MRLSVVIPTRRCDEALAPQLRHTRRCLPDAQIIVVDPLSDPAPASEPAPEPAPEPERNAPEAPRASTVAAPPDAPPPAPSSAAGTMLDETGATLIQGQRGRGTQCNAGARAATGDLLLFLHDDTWLPDNAATVIQRAFASPANEVACFRLRFDRSHALLRLYAQFSAIDSYLTSFGDQGILIRRRLFDRIGGFPDWPLFEDVELLRRARKQTRVRKLPAAVTTSAVRFVERGIVRQQLLNAELMLRFTFGADPQALRERYERGSARDATRHGRHSRSVSGRSDSADTTTDVNR